MKKLEIRPYSALCFMAMEQKEGVSQETLQSTDEKSGELDHNVYPPPKHLSAGGESSRTISFGICGSIPGPLQCVEQHGAFCGIIQVSLKGHGTECWSEPAGRREEQRSRASGSLAEP